MSLGCSQHRLTKTFSPIILSSRHQGEKKKPNISAFTSQFIWNFTATLWFLEDPSSTPVYVHAVIVLFMSEFDWLAPPCGTNLITCLKSVIIVQLNAGCLRCQRRNKKRRCDLLKSRDAPAQSDGSFEELEEVTKGRFCIRLIKVTWIIRQH